MTTRKVRKGQRWVPPSHADENAKAAAADAYRRGPDGVPERQQPINDSVVMVKNSSGTDFRRYDVLGLKSTALLTATERERIWLDADKLTSTNIKRNCTCVVLLDPLPNGKIGPAQIMGAGLAYVNVQATWHKRAFPKASSDVLYSGIFGPLDILVTPAGTGERLCYVRIGHADNRGMFCKTTSAISAATLTSGRLTLGSGTAKIHDPYSTAGQYDDSTNELTVYNMAGEEVATGWYGRLVPTDDWLPMIAQEPCIAPVEPS